MVHLAVVRTRVLFPAAFGASVIGRLVPRAVGRPALGRTGVPVVPTAGRIGVFVIGRQRLCGTLAGIGTLVCGVGQRESSVVERGIDRSSMVDIDANPWAGKLAPDPLDHLAQLWSGNPAHGQDIGVGRAGGHGPPSAPDPAVEIRP
ncbi:hypothetical protein G352_01267 [Rhodococcus ruber BKS 20-38]|uniref:Uncharacterized protein n=1 Tax=Rhodococcus ruber BKS 20-38 TaxID=1278076 RepID=M2Y2B2_9NOCA|nr:hypothetical protein G352_01267 [Rhodococcus ruber BKS 20-38]